MTLRFRASGMFSGSKDMRDLDRNPIFTIMAHGLSGMAHSKYWLEEDSRNIKKPSCSKPPYKVMSMSEIESLEWNGYNAISTFSGCGGSSLGYRMAGFKVLWASEFIDAARLSYNANKSSSTILDGRDIRQVKAEEILDAIKIERGQLDLMDGSPPCASFSTAGKREAGWGKTKRYSDKEQRTDDLFFEYVRLLDGIRPKMFVAENVSGLIKGTAKGYFIMIIKALKEVGYNVKCKVLDASLLGVPQSRLRTIFIGVRNDLGKEPRHPEPLRYKYSVRDACPYSFAETNGPKFNDGKRRFTIEEAKALCGFPADFILKGSYMQQWERLGRAVPPVMMSHVARSVRSLLDEMK